MQIGSATTPSPGVKVLAYVDASEPIVEPFLAARLDTLEKAKADAGSSLEAAARVHRAGASKAGKVMKGLLSAAMEVALPVLGGLVAGVPGLVVGGLGALAYGLLGNHRTVMGNLASAWEQDKAFPEPLWKGMRTYEIQADRTSGVDSKVTQTQALSEPAPSDLRDFLVTQMDPVRSNIVVVAGHGLGYRNVASMPLQMVAATMEVAERDTGRKADVLVMESCLMGNLEALNEMRDAARVAVLSEETLSVDALPLREMLADAARNGGTPQEIGRRMVEAAGKTGQVETLAAFDLDKIPALMGSLDTLGERLSDEIEGGRKPEIEAAVKEAMRYPQGHMLFLERKMLSFSDLGGFLDALSSRDLEPVTRQAAADARQALDEAIVAKVTSEEYKQASGVSFQSGLGLGPKMLDGNGQMGSYDSLDLPLGWRGFIEDLSA